MRLSWILLFTSCACAAALAGVSGPRIVQCSAVAPDTLAITVETGTLVPGRQSPCHKGPDDVVEERKHQRWVVRDGKQLGALVGPNDGILYTFDRVEGGKLDTRLADNVLSYAVRFVEEDGSGVSVGVRAVCRKSKPTAMGRTGPWAFDFPVRHILYLCLGNPLVEGGEYILSFQDGFLGEFRYRHIPRNVRSEAVHVTHLGFRPDDPVKVAYLSCWMGSGGGVSYGAAPQFEILEEETGKPVYRGSAVLSKAAQDLTEDPYGKNYNGTDVYRMDFSGLRAEGAYRVYVEGIGCSYPFRIASRVWHDAFRVAARGFYHQRSGIELGPPYTVFRRPRCFHPEDGVVVYRSTCSLLDSGNGLNARGTDKNNFANLVAGKTTNRVADAWGGYFDAGDWDRRIQHLEATRLLLELAELFPDFVEDMNLNIPESSNSLPDVVDEALWNLDFFRRMQAEDGGISGGIESGEHPRFGEGSWQEQLDVMAYAPDMWSSYEYAGVAARAALWLASRDAEKAGTYGRSACRAMEYAEKAYASHDYAALPHAVDDARNLAAAELFRLTGAGRWHDLFLKTTVFHDPKKDLFEWKHHDQYNAAFVYVRTYRDEVIADVRTNAFNALKREADASLKQGRATAFNWTKRNAWAPVGWGMLAAPQVVALLRVHALCGADKYLEAAVLAAQMGAGANPANVCYTTGLGHAFPRDPLWLDSRVQGKPPPPGLTVYGPFDMLRNKDYWTFKVLAPALYPEAAQWPTTEAWFDVYLFPSVTEFTVMQTLGPNTYTWGYLAARAPTTVLW